MQNITAARYFVINTSIYSSQIKLHVIGFNGRTLIHSHVARSLNFQRIPPTNLIKYIL